MKHELSDYSDTQILKLILPRLCSTIDKTALHGDIIEIDEALEVLERTDLHYFKNEKGYAERQLSAASTFQQEFVAKREAVRATRAGLGAGGGGRPIAAPFLSHIIAPQLL